MAAIRAFLHPIRGLLCLGLLLAAVSGHAAGGDAFTLGGFGTLGVTYNHSDDFEFVRDLTQGSGAEDGATTKVDSNIGVQLEYRFLPDLEGVVQIVSRHDQDGSIPPEVNWAYLKYGLSPAWDLRAGRLSWDVFMLSDSRNVGYSYLWVRPPVEYFTVQQISHIDGADVVFTRPLGAGVFWLKLYGGYADEKLPLDSGGSYDLDGSRVVGGHVNYQAGRWWFRFSYGNSRLDNALDSVQPLFAFMRASNPTAAALADDIQLENATVEHFVAGVVYERGPFQAQVMLNRTDSETLLFPDLYAGYTTLSYRLREWTPYATFAFADTDRVSRDSGFPAGSPPDQNVQALLESARIDQHTTSLGVRYDFRENMALKLQVDRLWARSPEAAQVRRPESDWDGRGTIVSATLDFVF